MMKNFFFKPFLGLLALAVIVSVGCGDDDEMMGTGGDAPAASFQFSINPDNFLEVTFENFSQNANSFTWDFGDGGTSSDESPTYTYAGPGEFTVTLTASDGSQEASRSETITITDPDVELALLAGATSKTWYLQREGIALGIGPAVNDNAWWSFGGVTPLGDRPCILNDAFTFHRDGTWEFESGGDIFVDAEVNGGWLGPDAPEGCYEENTANLTSIGGTDVSAFGNGGAYNYEFNPSLGTLTINGDGAFIGLSSKTSAGDNPFPISTKTYQVFNFADGDIADTLHLALVGDANDFSWNFYLVSYDNADDLPPLPSAEPRADFNFVASELTVEFQNTSANATSFMWNFGDGGSSTDENPVYTYSADGEYEVTLTVSDGATDNSITKTVAVSSVAFSVADLSSETGKIWRLDGEGSYIVGPAPGSGEWWAGIDAAGVDERGCQLDDEFIFFDDGTFQYDAKGLVWSEAHTGIENSCVAEADLPAPFDVLTSNTHSFEATDQQITVNGLGAFIGWNKPFNEGELDGSNSPVDQITYEVLGYTRTGNTERLTITIDYVGGGGGFWTMRLISEN